MDGTGPRGGCGQQLKISVFPVKGLAGETSGAQVGWTRLAVHQQRFPHNN